MKRLLLIALGCAAFLAGCTESTILDPTGPAVPETEIIEGIQIDWNQVQDELDEEFVESDDYPYGKNIDFYVEDGNAYMMVTVEDGVSKEEAAEYATAIIKALNDSVAMQDFSYQNDGTSMYGKFSQENVVWIYVMPESTADEERTWLGAEEPVVALEQHLVVDGHHRRHGLLHDVGDVQHGAHPGAAHRLAAAI